MPAWMALIRTQTRLWDELEGQMRRDYGLTMARYDVLAHLDLAGGRLGLSELATTVMLSPSGLSKLLDRMDLAGLVERLPDPHDARSSFASITAAGRSMVRKARRGHHELLRRLFADALDDGDLSDLERIMGRIKVSIEAG
jgi:DNA-binding MarR family transcriptional regulator